MTGPSWVMVLSALAAIVAVLILFGHGFRQVRSRAGIRSATGSIEILCRVGLAPKQGVATLRVGGRTLLVAYGEGGVRTLGEVDEKDLPTIDEDEDEVAVGLRPAIPAGRATWSFAEARGLLASAKRRVSGLRVLMFVLVVGTGMAGVPSLHAQSASPAAAGAAAVVAQGASTQEAVGGSALGPHMSLTLGGSQEEEGLQLSGPVGTVLFIGFMTLIPTLLLLMTSFTRILIVLHLLKQALGTQTAPPAHLLAAIALLLTGFVMAPTFGQIQTAALDPWMNGEIDELEMLTTAAVPMREFMLMNTREQDLASFVEMRDAPPPETIDDVPLVVVTSAFVTSELTSAFQMGFALFLPFVVLDIVVASVLMSMGMFMLPPVMVSLPFKLLLFVLVDGWSLVMTSLVRSF